MKPAFLTSEYPHSQTGASGGIGTSIRNLAHGLAAEGLSVSVLVYGQQVDAVFQDGEVTIYRIKNRRLKGFSWLLTRKKIQKLINELHRTNKIDFMEAPDWTGITSFIQPKCPVIIRFHGSDSYFCHLEKRKVHRLNYYHEKRALVKADKLVSVSKYTADVTKEIFHLKRDISVIPNCIPPKESAVVKSQSSTIIYFGTLIRKKGMMELPLIFSELIELNPAANLVLIGNDAPDALTGSHSTWELMLPLFSTSALKNMQYLGAVPHHEISKHIEKATVCVFPTFAEALPVSWLEAMAIGKAIVASNIGWANEIVDDGKDGFLVNPKQHSEFAKKIQMLLADEELRSTLGANAIHKVSSRFATSVVVKQNIEFYTSIL